MPDDGITCEKKKMWSLVEELNSYLYLERRVRMITWVCRVINNGNEVPGGSSSYQVGKSEWRQKN